MALGDRAQAAIAILLIVILIVAGAGYWYFTQGRPPFEVSDFSITLAEVEPGEKVTISFDVKNTGEIEGTYLATLSIDDEEVENISVELSGGENKRVVFTVVENVPKTYEVEVDGLKGSFEVVPSQVANQGWSTPQKIGDKTSGFMLGELASIAVDPDGHWHVVYRDFYSHDNRNTTYIKCINETSGPYVIAEETFFLLSEEGSIVGVPSIAIDSKGGLHVTYNYVVIQAGDMPLSESIMYTYKANTSTTWSTPQKIGDKTSGFMLGELASIAVDPDGHWHVVYRDFYSHDNRNTTYIKCINETSGPYVIAEETFFLLSEEGSIVGVPSIAIDSKGGLHVTYNYVVIQAGDMPLSESIMYTYKAS